MRKPRDFTGVEWGNWVVVCRDGTANRMAAWKCRCTNCGHEQRVGSNRISKAEGVVCERCSQQPPTKRSLCSDEDFIRAWQLSDTVREVCKKLGGTPIQVSSIAARLRHNGVPLKKMRLVDRSRERYSQLAKLAEHLAKEKR